MAVRRRFSSIGPGLDSRSKAVGLLIGLKSLVVVFGRRALSASDRGGIGIRRVVADRRVASVIELIGLRALDWGFRRSVCDRRLSSRAAVLRARRVFSLDRVVALESAACPRSGRLAVDGLSVGGWSGSGLHACWSRAAVSADLPVVSEVLPPGCGGPPRPRDEIWSTGGSTPRWRGSTAASPGPRFGGVTPFWRGSTGQTERAARALS